MGIKTYLFGDGVITTVVIRPNFCLFWNSIFKIKKVGLRLRNVKRNVDDEKIQDICAIRKIFTLISLKICICEFLLLVCNVTLCDWYLFINTITNVMWNFLSKFTI